MSTIVPSPHSPWHLQAVKTSVGVCHNMQAAEKGRGFHSSLLILNCCSSGEVNRCYLGGMKVSCDHSQFSPNPGSLRRGDCMGMSLPEMPSLLMPR